MAIPKSERPKVPYAGKPKAPARAANAPEGPGLARHVVEVVGPPIDPEKLGSLLSRAFQSRSVKIRSSITLREAAQPPPQRLSRLGQAIVDAVSDGRPWRSKHLVERVIGTRQPATVRKELEKLWDEGLLAKPRSGVWMLAGLPEPADEDIPPLRARTEAAPSALGLLSLLETPVSARALKEHLGVSGQRIDQMLKDLLQKRQVTRVAEPGRAGRWLWVKAGVNAYASLRHVQPSLVRSQSEVLNALEPGAFHSIGDLAAVTRPLAKTLAIVRRLEAQGLVSSVRLGQKRYASVTPRGLRHPSRSADDKRAKASDMSRAFGGKQIAFLETLAVLGEAKTSDVTAALAGEEPAGGRLLSGQMAARFLKSGLAERVPGIGKGRAVYRLSEAGKLATALIARDRKPPTFEEVHARIAAHKEKRAERLSSSHGQTGVNGIPGPASPAQAELLKALEAGPLPTTAIQAALAGCLKNTNSVYLMLRALSGRGLVAEIGGNGRAKVWALPGSAGEDGRSSSGSSDNPHARSDAACGMPSIRRNSSGF